MFIKNYSSSWWEVWLPSVWSAKKIAGKRFADDEEVETEVRKWLRQQSEDFCAAGFDTLIKRWDKCISVSGGYVEKCFFFWFQCHVFYVLDPFVTYLLTLPRKICLEYDTFGSFEISPVLITEVRNLTRNMTTQ
jgi:hypothetical protein